MSDWQRDLAREEFAALRATIRERGNLRVILFVVTVAAWGLGLVTPSAHPGAGIASFVRLLILAAGLEAVSAVHLGVERVGRYLEVRFESRAEGPAWERTAMAWGRHFPGTGTDPLFGTVFLLAALLNFAPVTAVATPLTLAASALAHGLFLWRLAHLRRWVRRQRAEDLARFEQLLKNSSGAAS